MSWLKVLFLLLLPVMVNGQYYEKIFYGQRGSACAREDSTGNIIVSFPDDSMIVKYDSALNVIWSRQYDFNVTTFEILNNGNWICGGSKSQSSGRSAFMTMLDSNGDTIWNRVHPLNNLTGHYEIKQMVIDNNHDFIFATSDNRFYKVNMNGDSIQCTNTGYYNSNFNINSSNKIITVIPNYYNGIEVTMYDTAFNQEWSTVIIDTNGNPHIYWQGPVFPSWGNVLIGGGWDWYASIVELSSGGIYNPTIYLCYGTGHFTHVIHINSGGYLCLGFDNNAFAMRLGQSLTAFWQTTFLGIDGVTPTSAQTTRDGGFLVSGYTDSSTYKIPWMYKMNSSGVILTTNIPEIKTNVSKLEISFSNSELNIFQQGGNKIIISDLLGNRIRTIETVVDRNSFEMFLASGIYIVSLYNDKTILQSKKLIVN